MTTITVEIDKEKDILAVTEFIGNLGLKYHVNDDEGLTYTDELKELLDERYAGYTNGRVSLVSEKESQKRIQALLSSKVK